MLEPNCELVFHCIENGMHTFDELIEATGFDEKQLDDIWLHLVADGYVYGVIE